MLNKKVLILVAVRLNSTRLPKKALADLCGFPIIIHLTERVSEANIPDEVIWCTSTNSQDDPIEQLASKYGIACFRGSEMDVMSRFIQVSDQNNAKTIVRVTGDNPLTDPVMMDTMIEAHVKKNAEYTFTKDLPVGTRSEIIDVGMLKRCHKLLQDPDASEYMTWMLNRPKHFKILHVPTPKPELKRPEISLTVDTESDLRIMRKIYDKFEGKPRKLQEIIYWLDKNPEILENKKDLNGITKSENVNYRLIVD